MKLQSGSVGILACLLESLIAGNLAGKDGRRSQEVRPTILSGVVLVAMSDVLKR
jgi:hypothetical protein